MSALNRIARCAGRQAGDTLIEVLVAAVFGIVIIAALTASVVSGSDSSLGAQRESTLVEVADQQMENIHQLVKVNGFSALAMSSLPPAASSATVKFSGSTPLDPNSFVTSCGSASAYEIEQNYDNTSEGLVSSLPTESPCTTAGFEPLITGGSSSLGPASVTVGSMTISLDYYVTATSVGCNTSLGTGSCTNDARRVIVAAVDSQAASNCSSAVTATNRCAIGADAPVYLSTIFTNPIPSNWPKSYIGITLGTQLG